MMRTPFIRLNASRQTIHAYSGQRRVNRQESRGRNFVSGAFNLQIARCPEQMKGSKQLSHTKRTGPLPQLDQCAPNQ